MRNLRGLVSAAAACLFLAGSLQAQTAIGQAQTIWQFGGTGLYDATGSGASGWNFYINPYALQAKINPNPNPALLPPAGTSTFGPTWDAFCVDFNHDSYFSPYNAYFTNLADAQVNSTWLGTYTRSNDLQKYLAAAYLAEEMQAGSISRGEGTGAIWYLMSGEPHYWWNGASWQDVTTLANTAYATGSVDPSRWVVVTGFDANGLAHQEYITQVTPEPATLLLLGTGLAITLLAAGALRKPSA